jgi:hypothetical protein
MSYDISFRVKVQDKDIYVGVGHCEANTTWNVREMIVKATGLEWVNEASNGYCKDVIPKIEAGLKELTKHPENYKPYESPNGWGTVKSTARFFKDIIDAWDELVSDDADLAEAALFWIS